MSNLEPINQTKLYGLDKYFNELIRLYKKKIFPNKILLSGQKGIGKSTLAFHLINYVLTLDQNNRYDIKNFELNINNSEFKTVLNKTNTNLTTIDVNDDKKNIDINQIRNLIINLNKSSFNNKPRFVLIDNIELLSVNSINALLKILEEPNENINFILINNNKKVLPTLKSRCLNFKIFLTKDQSIKIVNQLLNDDINKIINNELFDNYTTPGKLLRLIKLSEEYNLDLFNLDLRTTIKTIIRDKIYKKDKSIIKIIYSFIELYFRSNISIENISLLKSYHYFLKKINNTKVYNLDEETLFMEFEDKILNG